MCAEGAGLGEKGSLLTIPRVPLVFLLAVREGAGDGGDGPREFCSEVNLHVGKEMIWH